MCDPLGLFPLSLLALVAAAQLGRALRPERPDAGGVSGENHPGDHRVIAGDHRVISGDHRVISGDHRVISGDHRVIAAGRPGRSAHAAAQARYKAKCKALGRAYGTLRQLAAADDRVIAGDHPPPGPKKEKEDDLSLSDAGAREALLGPAGYQRKIGWCTSIIRRGTACGLLTPALAGRLYGEVAAMRPDRSLKNWGLPRRINDELDRLARLLDERQAAPRAPPKPPAAPAQREFLYPVRGGGLRRGSAAAAIDAMPDGPLKQALAGLGDGIARREAG